MVQERADYVLGMILATQRQSKHVYCQKRKYAEGSRTEPQDDEHVANEKLAELEPLGSLRTVLV